jgi:hypothetical protein
VAFPAVLLPSKKREPPTLKVGTFAATVRDARASESETLTCKVCEPIGRRPAEKVRPPAVVSEAVNAILVVLLHVWPARLPHLGG